MSKQILIVDDDTMMLQLMRLDIEQKNLEIDIVSAEDGLQAIEVMEREQPSVLVLDLRLPKADGFAVLEHVQKQKYAFPIIVLTNYNKPEYRERCITYGVHEYIIKSEMKIGHLMEKLQEYAMR